MNQLAGGTLADGKHALHLLATDAAGNVSQETNFSFTLLTTPPAVPTFDLAAGTADLGAEQTSAGHVTLIGQAGPGDTVLLAGTSLSALVSGTGTFQIPGVALTSGANVLNLQAEDLAGNIGSSTALTVTYTPPTSSTPPNPVIVWNQATLNAIETDGTDPLMSSRALAMVQAAVYDAVNNVGGTPAYYVKVAAPADSSIDAAVDAAAHDVLGYLYPAQQATFDTLLTAQLALLPAGQGTTDGETVGQAVGNAIIAQRANDGAKTFDEFTPGTAAGDWQPTPPSYSPAPRSPGRHDDALGHDQRQPVRHGRAAGPEQPGLGRRRQPGREPGGDQQHYADRGRDESRQVLERRCWHATPRRATGTPSPRRSPSRRATAWSTRPACSPS